MTATAGFKKIATVATDYDIPVTKYRSERTGLEVTFVDVDTPLVNGFFTLATEEAGDDLDRGQPHVLEHGIFLGSELYPYKGVLDTLANRARARGTNAWTATDHTAYTITTAGANGFAKIMPIYLDHVLYPTLTEAGFITEVYHVTAKGEDGGVVFSEMLGRENTDSDLAMHRMGQLLYPTPSGYGSETGGLMRKLRELDIERIRAYHTRYYRPDNLCLIITGHTDHAAMLRELVPVEDKIVAKGPLPDLVRPWVHSDLPDVAKTTTETVYFPDEDESTGNVVLGFRGPAVVDAKAVAMVDALLMYLTDSSVSLLKREFVEAETPLATDVNYYMAQYKKTGVMVFFNSVATEDLAKVETEVMRALADHKIDMTRMRNVLELRRLRSMNAVESDPAMAIAGMVITHYLYGDRENPEASLPGFLNESHLAADLAAATADDWQAVLNGYLVNAKRVTLLATPSAELTKKLAAEEAERVRLRNEDPADLERRAAILAKAMAENDTPIPPEIITGFEVPPLDAELPATTTAQVPLTAKVKFNNKLQTELESYGPALPFFVQLDDVHSQFLGVRLVVDTAALPADLRNLLSLYLQLLFASPLTIDGAVVAHEDVVAGLNADTVSFSAACGANGGGSGASFACGAYESQISLAVRVTPERYARGVEWITRVVHGTVFDPARIATVLRNLVGDIPQMRRDAFAVAAWTVKGLVYDVEKSNHAALALPNQQSILPALLAKVEAGGDEAAKVVSDLARLHNALFVPANLRLHVSGAVAKLGVPAVLAPWAPLAPSPSPVVKTNPVLPAAAFRTALGTNPNSGNGNAKLVNIPSNESGYLQVVAAGMTGPEHPDLAATMVAYGFFSALEGPFWKSIRGAGLAYGASLSVDPNSGLVSLSIYRAANVVLAYERARDIVNEVLAETDPHKALDPALLDAAKASIVYSVIAREESPRDAAAESFTAHALAANGGTSAERYTQWLVQQIDQVTAEDAMRVCREYLPRLFDPATALLVGVTGPSKLEDTVAGFKRLGIEFTVVKLDE
ncbi:hypothetical protein H9P43_007298 [Blastocladiella emersonii ATCC 22665]|nr:hypothetical protein H9P43_007298 [Blastocladiella emersonii ATCC 22665]